MWPPEALAFLRELEDNNDSAWFRGNRARYNEFLLDEFTAADPTRLIALAQMPAVDTTTSVKWLRQAKKSGFRGA